MYNQIISDLGATGQNLEDDVTALSGDLIESGRVLGLDISSLESATGLLHAATGENRSNLILTGNFLTSEIAIVSGIAGGSDVVEISGRVDTLSGNLITTGQYLTNEIAIVSGLAGGADVDALSGNLITTGQTLQTQITSNDSDISTLTSNLITTGQTLEDKKFNKSGGVISGDILPNVTETINLGSSTKKWDNIYAKDGHFDSGTLFLGTAGANIKVVDNRIQLEGDSAAKGPQFQGDVIINNGTLTVSGNLAVTANQTGVLATAANLATSGQTLQTQIASNDTDISTLTTNLITTGQTLTSEIAIVSGLATG